MGETKGTDPLIARRGLVVARRCTGLGDCLVSLLPAWRYAKETGRHLAVDWRRSPYCLTLDDNAFDLFFDPARSFGEMYSPLSALPDLESSVYPPPSTQNPWERPSDDPHRQRVEAILRGSEAAPEQVLVCDFCVNGALPDLRVCRELLSRLHVRPHWRRLVHDQARRLLQPGPVIGLHVRRGDEAGNFDHRRFWTDPREAIARITESVLALRQTIGNQARVFLCTDSRALEESCLQAVPDSFSRNRRWPADNQSLHRYGQGWLSVSDTIVDMRLLAECDAVVRYPPNSFFSFWADTRHQHRGIVIDGAVRLGESAYTTGRPAVAWSH